MNNFAERLKFVLKEKNIKASELSLKTGISKSSISDWLNERYEAKQDKIFLIAEALDVNEGFLLGLDVPMNKIIDNDLDTEKLNTSNIQSNNNLISDTVKMMEKLDHFHQKKVLNFIQEQVEEQTNFTSSVPIDINSYLENSETATLIVHGLESAGAGEWQEDDLDMEVQIPVNQIPDEFDDLAMVLGDSMRPMLHNGDVLFIKFTKQIEIGEIGVFRTSRGNFVKKLRNGYLESLNPDYEDIYFQDGEQCEAIGVVVDYYRK